MTWRSSDFPEYGSETLSGWKVIRRTFIIRLKESFSPLITSLESLARWNLHPQLGNKSVLSERGKTHFVTNNKFDDKVINQVICDEILTPALKRFLIHDNGASQKGKGVSFTDSVSKNTCLSSTLQTKDLFYSAIFQVTMQISGMINVLKFWRIS